MGARLPPVEINGRRFDVEKRDGLWVKFVLRGKRGAIYGLIESPWNRKTLTLVNLRTRAIDPLGPIVLVEDPVGGFRVRGRI